METTSENIGRKTACTILEIVTKAQLIFKVISLFKELEEPHLVSLLLPVPEAPEQGSDDKD
jgi:DNA repair photolyase